MIDRCLDFFKALSDPTRQEILRLLKDGEMNVTAICQRFDMSQPSISHHLAILKRAGLVEDDKKGKEVFYKLNTCCMVECCQEFFQAFGLETRGGS